MLKRRPSAHLHNSLTSKKFCAERMQRQGNSQKKSSSQGEDFFASCLLVHKLCLIFTSYLATHKLFLTLQAVCRHTIVSIFANCLMIHNFFNLQVVCFQTIYFNSYKPFVGANNCFNFSKFVCGTIALICKLFGTQTAFNFSQVV